MAKFDLDWLALDSAEKNEEAESAYEMARADLISRREAEIVGGPFAAARAAIRERVTYLDSIDRGAIRL